MQPRRVEILPSFETALRSLPGDMQRRAEEAVVHFVDRTAENSLRPELKNGFEGVWSFRISKGYRAFYVKSRDHENMLYHLFYVGHHDDYRVIKNKVPRVSLNIKMTPTRRK